MDSKIILLETVCHDEIVDYLAARYCITPEEVIVRFMRQEGIVKSQSIETESFFEENEMAILRDMGILPSCVKFMEISHPDCYVQDLPKAR